MHSRSHRSSNDSRRRRSHTDRDSRLSVTEANFQHLSLTSQSPSPTHPTFSESDPSSSFVDPRYDSSAYHGAQLEGGLEAALGNDPTSDPIPPHWPSYTPPTSLDHRVPVLQFGLDPSHLQPELGYDATSSQPEAYSSATMSSLDYVTMLPSGPFVPQGFYNPSQYPSMTGYPTGDLDQLTNSALGSSVSNAMHAPPIGTSSSSYPSLSSTVDREIERQRRRHSPGREWQGRRPSHRERSTSTSSYRSSRRSSTAAMAYSSVPGMAAQQPLPPSSSESPAFTSPFLTVSSSPPSQGYYSTMSQRGYDSRPDPPGFEYPPLPSQPLYSMDRTLPPSAISSLDLPPFGGQPSISSSGGVDDGVRVVGSRPKPQCWDHGCNGRQFSTFSNLLRHQREKSGTATKSECPYCGTVFTRTTARNGHMAQGKCKGQGQGQGQRKDSTTEE